MSELPDKLLVEIGFIASEFAVIDQEIRMDLIHLRAAGTVDQKWDRVPWGFGALLEAWHRTRVLLVLPEHKEELADLYARLQRRSEASNIALHGVWRVNGPDDYVATAMRDKDDALYRDTVPTTYAGLREQSELVRAARADLVLFLRRVHGLPD